MSISNPVLLRIRRAIPWYAGRFIPPALARYIPRLARVRNNYVSRKQWQERHRRNHRIARLDQDQIRTFTSSTSLTSQLSRRQRYYKERPLESTILGQVVPLVNMLIASDSTIGYIANIGTRYAIADHALASANDGIHFIGVDFDSQLESANQEFSLPNLEFRQGYALEMIEQGALAADVFLFSSTAALISPAELISYFVAIRHSGKYVVVNEPVMATLSGRVVAPHMADAYEPPSALDATMVHNYPKLLEDAGYEILHYTLRISPDSTRPRDFHLAQIIARKLE